MFASCLSNYSADEKYSTEEYSKYNTIQKIQKIQQEERTRKVTHIQENNRIDDKAITDANMQVLPFP